MLKIHDPNAKKKPLCRMKEWQLIRLGFTKQAHVHKNEEAEVRAKLASFGSQVVGIRFRGTPYKMLFTRPLAMINDREMCPYGTKKKIVY